MATEEPIERNERNDGQLTPAKIQDMMNGKPPGNLLLQAVTGCLIVTANQTLIEKLSILINILMNLSHRVVSRVADPTTGDRRDEKSHVYHETAVVEDSFGKMLEGVHKELAGLQTQHEALFTEHKAQKETQLENFTTDWTASLAKTDPKDPVYTALKKFEMDETVQTELQQKADKVIERHEKAKDYGADVKETDGKLGVNLEFTNILDIAARTNLYNPESSENVKPSMVKKLAELRADKETKPVIQTFTEQQQAIHKTGKEIKVVEDKIKAAVNNIENKVRGYFIPLAPPPPSVEPKKPTSTTPTLKRG